jgi:predicted O-methyltransferase YrrM
MVGEMDFLQTALQVPGWRQGEEAAAVYAASYSRPDHAVIVEVGAFLGRSTILLAGARKLRGSGRVHSIDPFDCSGDAASLPVYEQILREVGGGDLRSHFEQNLRIAGVGEWVEIHQQQAAEAGAAWTLPIDLLLLDGDQSPEGARAAFDALLPHLKSGGILIMGNSTPRDYAPTHDGNWLITSTTVVYPAFIDPRRVGTATIAVKA